MVSVPCPLRTCDEVHEVRRDRSGNQFIACKTWRNSIWFRGVGESYLNGNGGAIRANPSSEPRTIQEARAARAGLVDNPFLCKGCGAVVEEGAPICPNGHDIEWPEESGEDPD